MLDIEAVEAIGIIGMKDSAVDVRMMKAERKVTPSRIIWPPSDDQRHQETSRAALYICDNFYENIMISVWSRKAIAQPAYQIFT